MTGRISYRSVLRAGCRAVDTDEALADFLGELRAYGDSISEVVFSPNQSHDIGSLGPMQRTAEQLGKAFAAIKSMGYAVGINIVCTVGHHVESPDETLDALDYMVGGDGVSYRGRLCPTGPKSLDYIEKLYAIFARLDISLLYSDDDLDYGLGCLCERCLGLFETRYGLFKENGRDSTISDYQALLSDPDSTVRKRMREAALDFYGFRQNLVYQAIERAVHAVNPGIRLGFMTCVLGTDGCAHDDWARSLAGSAGDVHHRPGGGVWTDFIPRRLGEKAHSIGRQIRYLPDDVTTVQAELENHPFLSLRKSASFMELEALSYLAAGCTGIAIWPTAVKYPDSRRYARYPVRIHPFASELVATFGRSKPAGVGRWWDKRTFTQPLGEAWAPHQAFPDEILDVGIPAAYDPAMMCACLLDAHHARILEDAEIVRVLAGGVLMDAEALTVLNDRGFGAHTGFRASDRFTGDLAEHDLAHPFNLPGENSRGIPFEFRAHQEMLLDVLSPAHSIVKTAAEAVYLTRLSNLGHGDRNKGHGSGVFSNALGGRVCVCGVSPFHWWTTYPRTVQLKNVMKWLSKNQLPAYIVSWDKIMLWCRRSIAGQPGALFANTSFDNAEDMTLALKSDKGDLVANIYENGSIKRVAAVKVSEERETGYSHYRMAEFKPFSVGYVLF